MPDSRREAIEATIGGVLLNEWDPLGVRGQPEHADEYGRYSHDIYGLLIRGASDVQVGRHLHQIEREEMHHPDADSRDLSALLKTLRALEKTM
ncbi:MAG: hypothetical protein M3Y64_05755 [Gemmatimonadota bacterium]|nr:hypothetical protein [Gemmatimonadota bacterium]